MTRVTNCASCKRRILGGRGLACGLVLALTLSLGMVVSAHAAKPRSPASIALAQERHAQELFNKGVAASDRQDQKAALLAYEEVVQQYGNFKSPALRTLAAKALLNKSSILSEQGKYDSALNSLTRIDNRYGQDSNAATREIAASALVSRAEIQYKKGYPGRAITIYQRFSRRFGKDDNGFIQQLVGMTKLRIAEIQNEIDTAGKRP